MYYSTQNMTDYSTQDFRNYPYGRPGYCWHFENGMRCKLQPCKYIHPNRNVDNQNNKRCIFYNNNKCARGLLCPFYHDIYINQNENTPMSMSTPMPMPMSINFSIPNTNPYVKKFTKNSKSYPLPEEKKEIEKKNQDNPIPLGIESDTTPKESDATPKESDTTPKEIHKLLEGEKLLECDKYTNSNGDSYIIYKIMRSNSC